MRKSTESKGAIVLTQKAEEEESDFLYNSVALEWLLGPEVGCIEAFFFWLQEKLKTNYMEAFTCSVNWNIWQKKNVLISALTADRLSNFLILKYNQHLISKLVP